MRASWAVVPGCTETFGLVLYYLSTLTYLQTSLSGVMGSLPESRITRADDHRANQQRDE